jgi:plastocyanin
MQLLPTSFRALLLCGLLAVPANCSTVTGQVEVTPASKHSRTISDIAVWLDPVNPPPKPSEPEHIRLLQKGKSFHPHLLVVRTGTIVDFPNADPIFHNAFSTYDGQLFDVGLYPPGTNRSIRFRRPGIVRVFCNIHPSMSAVIVVVDSPYFTTASDTGEYRLENVPEGAYRLNVYDERATEGRQDPVPIQIGSGQPHVEAPVIRLSETGFVKASHKNKYGLDYPPGSDATTYDRDLK